MNRTKLQRLAVVCLAWLINFSVVLPMAATEKDTLRVLAIGNSFSQDAVEQNLHELGKSVGYTIIIGNMYIGGCSLERHVRNARNDAPAYVYCKINAEGEKTKTDSVSLARALVDEPWDYVSMQQASPLSGIYESYTAFLPELKDYVAQRTPEGAVLMLHQTWAYAAHSTHSGFKNYDSDQQQMYSSIVSAVKRAAQLVGISKIIPTGTAIQNARTSYIGDHMDRDGYHLDLQIGRYTAACTWLEALTGQNVIGMPYAPKGVNYDDREVAQTAAHAAILCSDDVTDLADLKQPARRANYDETLVPVYTLPDVLKLKNGEKVTTARQWMQKRRPELLELFAQEMFGKAPAHPRDMHFRLLSEDWSALGGLATRKEVNVYPTEDEKKYFTLFSCIFPIGVREESLCFSVLISREITQSMPTRVFRFLLRKSRRSFTGISFLPEGWLLPVGLSRC